MTDEINEEEETHLPIEELGPVEKSDAEEPQEETAVNELTAASTIVAPQPEMSTGESDAVSKPAELQQEASTDKAELSTVVNLQQGGETPDQSENIDTLPEKPKQKRKSNKPHKPSKQFTELVSHFSACGRCSYFLAGYRVIHGVENMETAVNRAKSGWLQLTWNYPMRDLLSKSFGVELNVDYFHYDGCCPECGRHYAYQVGEEAAHADVLRMEMRRRGRS